MGQRQVWERERRILVLDLFQGDQTLQAQVKSEEEREEETILVTWQAAKMLETMETSWIANDHLIPGIDC